MHFNVAVLAWGEGEKKFKHTYSRDCSEFFLYIYTYTRGKIYRYLQLAIIAFIFSSTDTLVIILGQMERDFGSRLLKHIERKRKKLAMLIAFFRK